MMSVSVLKRLSEAAGRVSTYGGMILILYIGGKQVPQGQMDVGGLAASGGKQSADTSD